LLLLNFLSLFGTTADFLAPPLPLPFAPALPLLLELECVRSIPSSNFRLHHLPFALAICSAIAA
jgi:hypothetical protein